MATEYELTLSDYLSIMRRRAPYLLGIFVLTLVIAVQVTLSIPPTYRSGGTILVESPLVSENSVPGAIRNNLDERIDIIKQRVTTRDNLLQIVKKYGLFSESIGSMSNTDLIEKMRERIAVEPISANTSREGRATIAFTISFDDQHPEVALQVANDLVARFLRLNQRETMRARAERDLYEVERNIRITNEEIRTLQAELSAVNARHGTLGAAIPSQTLPATAGEDAAFQMLQTLKADYARLSAVYTESHPDVRALRRKITALEQAARTPGATSPRAASVPTANYGSAAYAIRVKVDAANAKLDSLMQQKQMLHEKISESDRTSEQPAAAGQESEMLHERDNVKRNHEEIHAQKVNAQIAQNVEGENKWERFSLLDPPVLPDKPIKPNRLKFLMLGFILAVVSSGSAVMALESIDKRISGTEALAHVLGYRPLVTVPYLFVKEEEERRRRTMRWALAAFFVLLLAGAIAVHFLYIRLDVLLIKTLASLA